jgi:MFS family permease
MSEVALIDVPRHRRWLVLATIGCALVACALIAVLLVTFDKTHFGWLAGTWFLEMITSGVLVGAVILLISAWNLPDRTWRRWFLLIWSLIAITSPAFGLLFIVPWALLFVTLPVVMVILRGSYRGAGA